MRYHFGVDRVLALAKGLTSLPGIRIMKGKQQATYITLLLDRHQIIIANGVMTESFYPGQTALKLLPSHQRAEIEAIFPKLRDDPDTGYGPTACDVLTKAESKKLAAKLKRSMTDTYETRSDGTQAPSPSLQFASLTLGRACIEKLQRF